jgi:hypothetical protein
MNRMISWLGAGLLVALCAAPAVAKDGDVVVRVKNRQGKAVADANVFFVVKTWPNQRYQQRAYQGRTDEKGDVRLVGKYVVGEKYAVQVAVLADGFALESSYRYVKDGKAFEPVNLRLAAGQESVLRFLDGDGRRPRAASTASTCTDPRRSTARRTRRARSS